MIATEKRKRIEAYTLKHLEKDITEISRRICVQLKQKDRLALSSNITKLTASIVENSAAGYQNHSSEDVPFLNLAIEHALELEKVLFTLMEEAIINNRMIAKLLLMLDEALEQWVLRLEFYVGE